MIDDLGLLSMVMKVVLLHVIYMETHNKGWAALPSLLCNTNLSDPMQRAYILMMANSVFSAFHAFRYSMLHYAHAYGWY